eukprot:s619_g29.t1
MGPKQMAIIRAELWGLILLAPLLQADLTADYDNQVTCSDASESGGACAVASSLSWSGCSLVGMKNDLRLQPLEFPLLIVSIFNGISGAFRVYGILGIGPTGRISVDISPTGNRVTRSTWPDVLELHDAELIDREEILRWARLFPHVKELHLYAGFPCIHLSSVRAYRQNLEGEGNTAKSQENPAQEFFSPHTFIKFCVENVASMDENARMTISDHLQVCPIKLDPSDILPVIRPRLAWCSETLYEMEGLELWTEREFVRAYMTGDPVETSQWIRPGWSWPSEEGGCFPTFMKSIKRQKPPPQPAGYARASEDTRARWIQDEYRYPPYQYAERFLFYQKGAKPRLLDSSERELLLGFGPGASVHPSVDVPMTRLLSYGGYGYGEPDGLCKPVVMPRNLPRVVLAARTRQGRQEQRRGIRLRDYTVTTRTKERYERAVGRILPFLEAQPDLADLDGIVCDYIELQWCRGETVNDIADCLSGLHFFWPHIKVLLRQSWRLFRSWRRVESPQRAPPITVWLVKAIVARAVDSNQLAFATLVALGFHCLLRTGELLALQFKDFECSDSCGVVSLFRSKSGSRTGAEEAVSIRGGRTSSSESSSSESKVFSSLSAFFVFLFPAAFALLFAAPLAAALDLTAAAFFLTGLFALWHHQQPLKIQSWVLIPCLELEIGKRCSADDITPNEDMIPWVAAADKSYVEEDIYSCCKQIEIKDYHLCLGAAYWCGPGILGLFFVLLLLQNQSGRAASFPILVWAGIERLLGRRSGKLSPGSPASKGMVR